MQARKRLPLAVLLLAFALAVPTKHASAITISPPVYDYTLNPGDTIRDVVKLYNESSDTATLYPETYNFTFKAGDEFSGTPEMYPIGEERDGRGLAPWIKLDSTDPLKIAPHARANLGFSITIPKDGSPGSYFGSVQLTTTPEQKGGGPNVSLVGSAGVLILARVNGNVVENLTTSRFSGDATLYTHLPVALAIRLENRGTVHLRPTGNVFITNAFGNQVASIPVNETFKSILPGSARRFDVGWTKQKLDDNASEFTKEWRNFAFGKYTATMVLNYGTDNKVITAAYDFWVVPWMVLATLLGGLIVLLIVLVFALRGYNRMIIRSYEAKQKRQNK